ncbi:hypothetical protein [Arthrobacter sulfonylureivorans]|uniref:Uncharacterized protein n=1 Tax=Arthrobacter sulfonylureivorans TaxID=2486855 RepID=A0ABY3WCN0_9MICC|nr:hypothetical protein [Arthrobacter sulfonylureivorans]UNK47766.1 hypothetical protein MNQ99_18760 [Arthrobacter sulfonylureivorans]
MSESDGMDDVLDNGMRQTLLMASRLAETLARRRQESLRQQEHRDDQALYDAGTRLAAERSAARAALAPVEKDQWWDKAQPNDIAVAHAVAEGWKDHDPAALAASERIREEVLTRYAVDTHDVSADAAYLESYIQTITTEKARQDALAASQDETRKAAAEHEKAMALLAAARAEELRAQAEKLAAEMERHQVPVEYLANPELAQALERAHSAKTPNAVAAADAEIKERLFLIRKDGVNGPDIDQLRKETTATINGADDSHFKDPAFVKVVKEMRETRLLAEGGFTGSQSASMEQRYERVEKELFTRLEGVGRNFENRVTGNDSSRLKDQGLRAETASSAGYGSAERQEAFAASLATTGANANQIRGRAAAERGEGTHPSAAVTMGKGAAKAKKTRTGEAIGAERARSAPSR